MKLEGLLATFPLRELIDMVVYSSVTGVLNIYGPSSVGCIYFRDSSVYHVEHGAATGVQALAELLELHQGEFGFVSEAVSPHETLRGGLSLHLHAAERLATRWRQIRAYVPTLELVPQPLLSRDAALRRVSPAYHTLFDAMNGSATLGQLAAQLGWDEIDVAEATAQLCVDGLIDLRKASQQGDATLHAANASRSRSDGFFDRLLGHAPRATWPNDDATARPSESGQRPGGEDIILRLLRDPG